MPDGDRSVVCHDQDEMALRQGSNGRVVFIRDPEGCCEEVLLRPQDRLRLTNLPKRFRQRYKTAACVECLYVVAEGQAGIFIPSVPGAGHNVAVLLAKLVMYEGVQIKLVGIAPFHLPRSAFDCAVPGCWPDQT